MGIGGLVSGLVRAGSRLAKPGVAGRFMRAKTAPHIRAAQTAPQPGLTDLIGQSAFGAGMSGLGTLATTGNPLAAMTAAGLDLGLSSGGAYAASKALNKMGPYGKAAAPMARGLAMFGGTIVASPATELSMGYGLNRNPGMAPQQQVVNQQVAQRPQSMMVQQSPGTMYQQYGMQQQMSQDPYGLMRRTSNMIDQGNSMIANNPLAVNYGVNAYARRAY